MIREVHAGEILLTDEDGDKLYINSSFNGDFSFEADSNHLQIVVAASKAEVKQIIEFLQRQLQEN